jgi:hypothetical protein
MRQNAMILIGAVAAGLAGGFALRDTSSATGEVAAQAMDWKPRNTISPERLATAEELDRQQPVGTGYRPAATFKRQAAIDTGSTWSYRNCAAARAAGAAPVYAGRAGYGAHLDRDGDGIGCEPYRGR